MGFFTKNELLIEAKKFKSYDIGIGIESYNTIYESVRASASEKFDYFISHSFHDKEFVKGLFQYLTEKRKRVYVDWIIDKQLDRADVNEQTALVLRQRMDNCKELLYAISHNAAGSKWMPWELGYFDAKKGKTSVKILPIVENAYESFKDQEFTKIYNKVKKEDFR